MPIFSNKRLKIYGSSPFQNLKRFFEFFLARLSEKFDEQKMLDQLNQFAKNHPKMCAETWLFSSLFWIYRGPPAELLKHKSNEWKFQWLIDDFGNPNSQHVGPPKLLTVHWKKKSDKSYCLCATHCECSVYDFLSKWRFWTVKWAKYHWNQLDIFLT